MNNLAKMIEEVQAEMRAAKNYSCADRLDPILEYVKTRTLTDIVDSIIVDVRSDMCDNYCKFVEECGEAMERGEEFPCPLGKL